MRMRERLYLTEDRSKVVSEDDRRGRHLLCKKGAELDDKVAARYGLIDGAFSKEAAKTVEPIIPPETKRAKKIVTQKSTRVEKVATKRTGRVIRFGGSKKKRGKR